MAAGEEKPNPWQAALETLEREAQSKGSVPDDVDSILALIHYRGGGRPFSYFGAARINGERFIFDYNPEREMSRLRVPCEMKRNYAAQVRLLDLLTNQALRRAVPMIGPGVPLRKETRVPSHIEPPRT